MSILKRHLAPLTAAAWSAVDEEARQTLAASLSARKLIDVTGPNGWNYAAANLGSLKLVETPVVEDVEWGLRQVQPLAEWRLPFVLNIWELDNLERGSATPDLDPVVQAATKVALYEEKLVYHGSDAAGVTGILPASPHEPVAMGDSSEALVAAIGKATAKLAYAGIGGPYAVVLGKDAYTRLLAAATDDYPPMKRTLQMAAAGVHWSPALETGVVISTRGDDYLLDLGVDHAIGYAGHNAETVELYLTGSLTFRVHDPAAAVALS